MIETPSLLAVTTSEDAVTIEHKITFVGALEKFTKDF